MTYVTDPKLSLPEQRRVLRDILHASDGFRLRVAFRLPHATDDEVLGLVGWYRNLEANYPGLGRLQEPLFHHRANLVVHTKEVAIWVPAHLLQTVVGAHAYSVHSAGEVKRAIDAGADEVIYGHVFETESHPGIPGHGVSGLLEAEVEAARSADSRVTITAIGGIHEGSIDAIGRAGVHSVACIRAVSRSPDITATLWTLHQNWNTGYAEFLRKGNKHD